jgi:hypothetical protein
VPPLIQFSNVATDEGGSSLSGVVSITFSLYSGQQGGEPLWTETQNNIQLATIKATLQRKRDGNGQGIAANRDELVWSAP